MNKVIIRAGGRRDLPQVMELVKELAEFERAPHEVTNTVAQMEIDGFGDHPIYGFYVAEGATGIIGISVYYYRYSTWKGKRLYLDDIVVREPERGKGIGKLLFEQTMRKSVEDKCSGMMWQVLEWNQPAIDFYKKYGAKIDAEWSNGSLESGQINEFFEG